jgi:hypothetical protein
VKKSVFPILFLILLTSRPSFARTGYCGYSGAPGSLGACASSCHGTSDGTIKIFGFPSRYQPLQQYTVKLYRVDGRRIRNFNASVRIGEGSQNAGTISPGLNTITYNVAGETNGVHLSAMEQDSATFVWTAPEAGTGLVKLYLGGYQGYDAPYGKNTTRVLSSVEKQAPLLTTWGTVVLCLLIVVSAIWVLRRSRGIGPARIIG